MMRYSASLLATMLIMVSLAGTQAEAQGGRGGAITPYVWFPGLEGSVSVGNGLDFDLGSSDVFESTANSFMVVGETRLSRRTRLFFDAGYIDRDKDLVPPGTAFSNLRYRRKEFNSTVGLSYRLSGSRQGFLDVTAAARIQSSENQLQLFAGNQPGFVAVNDDTLIDPVFGVRGLRMITNRVYVNGLADIGGFGISSESTWQAYGGVGYRINQNIALVGGYRALATDYEDGGFLVDLQQDGFLFGVTFGY